MKMTNGRKPDIYFRRNGQIDITAKVSRILDIGVGDAINVWHAGGEYYLYVAERNARGSWRGVCREVNNRSHYFRANFNELAKQIIEASGKEEAHLPVGMPIEMENLGTVLPLITRNNLYEDKH